MPRRYDNDEEDYEFGDDETMSIDEDSDDEEKIVLYSGQLLKSKYVLLTDIGHGNDNSVWLSYNIINKKFYAIKIHRPMEGLEENSEREIDLMKVITKSQENTPSNKQNIITLI